MLILVQRPGADVVITLPDGTHIEVCVLCIERNRVRIGYNAPRNIPIDRREIYERKKNAEAT